MDFKNLGKKSLEIILSAALGATILSSNSNAVETGDRYGCIAKVEGRYFTDGKTTMKEYPCKVDSTAVDSMVEVKKADKKTDQINFNHQWSQEYYTADKSLVDIRKMGEAKSGPSVSFLYNDICQKGNLENSGALLKVRDAFSIESEPGKEGISKQIYSNCEPFNKAHYPTIVFEQNLDNKNQMSLFTATSNDSKRKFMGFVDWVANVEEFKQPAEVAKAQKIEDKKTAKIAVVKSTNAYVNDFNGAQKLLSGSKLSYGTCKEARDILNRDIRSLRASTTTAKGYLEQFEKLRNNADLTACLAQMTEERLARYNEKGPVAGIGIEGKMTVFSAGLKKNGWAATGFYGTDSIKQDPQSTLTNGAPDALGYSRQRLDSYKFDSDVKRIGFEMARDAGMRSNISLGYRQDQITEKYDTLQTLRTLKNGNVIATQQRSSDGDEKIKVDYATIGLGYAATDNVTFSARASFPFKSKESTYGNKYGKTEFGASINYRFDTKIVNRPKNRGYYQKKAGK